MLSALLSLGFFVGAMHAATSPKASSVAVNPFTMSSAIEQYWGASPVLSELKTQTQMAERDVWRRFVPNEPSISYQKDESDRSDYYGVALNMGFPGQAFAMSKLDKAMLRQQRAEQNAKKQELAGAVTSAYLDCAVAQYTVQIREQALDDLESHLITLKSRRGVTQSEKLSLELETRQARRELVESRDSRTVGCRKINTLVAVGQGAQFSLPEDVDMDLIEQIGSVNADDVRAIATIDLAEVQRSTARWQSMPDVSLNFGQKVMPGLDGDKGHHYNLYGLTITLPIFYSLHEANDVRKAKSQASLDKAQAQLDRIQIGSDRLEAAKAFMRNRNDLREIRGKDLPMAQALLESSYSAYRAGQIGYAEMALSRKTLTELRLKDVELRSLVLNARFKCLDACETLAANDGDRIQ